jgi:predicted small lipoprotein YifL
MAEKAGKGEIVTVSVRLAMLAPVRGGLSLRPRRTALFRLGLACALAAGLSACGRKGPLDLPPAESAVVRQQQLQESKESTVTPLRPPIGGTAQPAPQNPGAPNRPFLLDPLLN